MNEVRNIERPTPGVEVTAPNGFGQQRPHFRLQRPPRKELIVHRATDEQAHRECEWKHSERRSLFETFVCASLTTLTLTQKAFSWKPFGSEQSCGCTGTAPVAYCSLGPYRLLCREEMTLSLRKKGLGGVSVQRVEAPLASLLFLY